MGHNHWSTIVQKLGGQIFVLTTVLKFSRPVSIKKKSHPKHEKDLGALKS